MEKNIINKNKIQDIDRDFLLSNTCKELVPLSINETNENYIFTFDMESLIPLSRLEFNSEEEVINLCTLIIKTLKNLDYYIFFNGNIIINEETVFLNKIEKEIKIRYSIEENSIKDIPLISKSKILLKDIEARAGFEGEKVLKRLRREWEVYNFGFENIYKIFQNELKKI